MFTILVGGLAALGLLFQPSAPCGGTHRPPVAAAIIDPFRPPPLPWLAGNRGVEYDTAPGDVVRASGNGVVAFAGPIGSHFYVAVDHGCGLHTTYSFLAGVTVARGEPVGRGRPVGAAGETPFHFGVRWFGVYLDPEWLFAHRLRRVVRLIE